MGEYQYTAVIVVLGFSMSHYVQSPHGQTAGCKEYSHHHQLVPLQSPEEKAEDISKKSRIRNWE